MMQTEQNGGTLLIGWFSFELMGATAGDLIAKDVACSWLAKIGIRPDVAMWSPSATGEVATGEVSPEDYETVVFVCGPIGDGPPLNEYLDRFPHARKFALNVTLLQDRTEWNPFEAIFERDSRVRVEPDITFAAADRRVPVLGLIYVGPQEEYPNNRHEHVEALVQSVFEARDIAVVPIDTRLDVNRYGLASSTQIESVIARMNAVLTTRLHGAVLALRQGVPAVAIDSIPGGSKLLQQMERIGWPLAFHVGDVNEAKIANSLEIALSEEGRRLATACAERARRELQEVEASFLAAVAGTPVR